MTRCWAIPAIGPQERSTVMNVMHRTSIAVTSKLPLSGHQGSRFHLGRSRAVRDQGPGRPRRGGDQGRDQHPLRFSQDDGALCRRHQRRQSQRLLHQPELRQEQHRHQPEEKGSGEALKRLVPTVDIVTNNFRAGVLEKLGFGYQQLAARQAGPDLCQHAAAGQRRSAGEFQRRRAYAERDGRNLRRHRLRGRHAGRAGHQLSRPFRQSRTRAGRDHGRADLPPQDRPRTVYRGIAA